MSKYWQKGSAMAVQWARVLLPVVVCPLLSRLLSGDRSFVDAYDGDPAPFQPPSWVFGPVWALLYAMLGYALERARVADDDGAVRGMLLLLALNVLWTPLFLRRYFGAALALLLLMDVQAAAYAYAHTAVRGWVTPYVAWILFATTLNVYYAFRSPSASASASGP